MSKAATGKIKPRDPNAALQEIIKTIDVLRDVYVRETAALNEADAKKFIALQETKLLAARKYQEIIDHILSRKEEIKTANPALKRKLNEMQKDFFDLSAKNMEALKRMQRTTERLGAVIMSAAKDVANKNRAVSYGDKGALQTDERKTVSMGVSETV